jgi:cyclase
LFADSPVEQDSGWKELAMKSRPRFVPAFVLAAVVLAAPLAAQQALKVQKLADGVWAAEPAKGANVGWFLLGDGVVAVDSGADAATAKDVLKQISETTGGKPVRLLILTHSHADHSGGARAFVAAGARVLCQESIAGLMLAFLTQPAKDATDPLSGKAGRRPVVESISERSIMVDGVQNAQIYFLGAAHTAGDLVVYLSGDKILFSGDLALNGRQPFMQSPDVDPAGWERSLQSLSRVTVEKLVPGHGEIGPITGLQVSLAYVSAVNGLANKLVAGGAPDELLDAQIRAPENAIPNVPLTEAHIANLKSSVKAVRDKAARKATPAPAPQGATTRAPLPTATPAP